MVDLWLCVITVNLIGGLTPIFRRNSDRFLADLRELENFYTIGLQEGFKVLVCFVNGL